MLKDVHIFSIGDPGDLTYNYIKIGNSTDDLKKILNNEISFQKNYYLQKTISNNW